MIDEGIYII